MGDRPERRVSTIKTKNIPPFFSVPMDAGMLTMSQLKEVNPLTGEPVLDMCDVADMNETLVVRFTNEARAHKAASSKKS